MKRKGILLSVFLLCIGFASFAEDCMELLKFVDNAVTKAQHNMDSVLQMTDKPDYLETYLIYPVISRHYRKSKNRDTAFVRKYEDLGKTVWCYKGTCFNNNKSFYLSKKQVADKIMNNDLRDGYLRETLCMLCDKYVLDTNEIAKLLGYNDTLSDYLNVNAANYALLHKALQLANLKKQKCINNDFFNRYKITLTDTIFRSFISTYPVSGLQVADAPDNAYDLFAEGILMISILDDKVSISDELYEKLIVSQLSDGGWGGQAGATSSNGHSTIVSLWALMDLQYKLQSKMGAP